jgi:hypothetical protein
VPDCWHCARNRALVGRPTSRLSIRSIGTQLITALRNLALHVRSLGGYRETEMLTEPLSNASGLR